MHCYGQCQCPELLHIGTNTLEHHHHQHNSTHRYCGSYFSDYYNEISEGMTLGRRIPLLLILLEGIIHSSLDPCVRKALLPPVSIVHGTERKQKEGEKENTV